MHGQRGGWSKEIDYGFDAPGVMRGLGLGATSSLLVNVGLAFFAHGNGVLIALSATFGLACLGLGFLFTCMFAYGKVGKFRERDRMISLISWSGDEHVLDIGTGTGLLLIAAAKRLNSGRAVGIDVWRAEDLSDNTLERLMANARAEGVDQKIEVITEDARELSFADESFDVVLSTFCIHNIEPKLDQVKACKEIARVLRPGGHAVIADYIPTHGYAKVFREAGLNVHFSKHDCIRALGPMWVVFAEKPAADSISSQGSESS
jgi:SAM-dependent methyltransferase